MKVTNITRKLAKTLVAAGLFMPVPGLAGDLNTNLVIDGGFENIDDFDVGPFESVRLLDWEDSDEDLDFFDDDFAYAYSQNYAGNNPPADAGLWHFTGGFNTEVGQAQIRQSIDIADGDTGTLVPTGSGFYNLSGYFSSYRSQNDSSGIRAKFLDSGDTEIGLVEIGGMEFVQSLPIGDDPIADQRDWGRDSAVGLVPAATQSVVVEVFSDDADTNHDGYVDLVDFRIGNASDFVLVMQVELQSGVVLLRNATGEAIEIDYYEVTSAAGSLSPTGWNSLQDQDFAGTGGGASPGDFDASGQVEQGDLDLVLLNWGEQTPPVPAGWTNDLPSGAIDQNELDGVLLNWGQRGGSAGPGEGWEEAGGSSATVLSESFLLGSSSIEDSTSVELGMAFDTTVGAGDLMFRYGLPGGDLVDGFVEYVSGVSPAGVPEPSSFVIIAIALAAICIGAGRR